LVICYLSIKVPDDWSRCESSWDVNDQIANLKWQAPLPQLKIFSK